MKRVGEIRDREFIEIGGGEVFLKCHFFDCQFTGCGIVFFVDCVFDGCAFTESASRLAELFQCAIVKRDD